jgi:hypothetical protein
MFAMCAAIIMVAWLLVVAAELLTGTTSSSSNSSSSSSSNSTAVGLECQLNPGQAESKPLDSLQQQQQWGGSSGVQQLRQGWEWLQNRLLGVQGAVGDVAAGRRRRQVYMELGSKDSGPDLAAVRQ